MLHRPSPARPRNALARAAALGGSALVAAAMIAITAAPATGWNQSSAEATLWQLMNGDRANNGRQLVQQQSTLIGLARWRSRDMVQRNYFDHTVAGTGYQVYHWYDMNGLSYVWGGENIGWNSGYADGDSPVAINQGFMNSASHRANILQPTWTHAGIGAFAADNVSFLGATRSPRMYTQLFMQARNAAPPPPPVPSPQPVLPPAPPAPPAANVPAPPAPAVAPPASVRAPAAAAARKSPARLTVARPVRPSAGHRIEGDGLLVSAALSPLRDGRVLQYDTRWMTAAAVPGQFAFRVDPPPPADGGMIDMILGSLLTFVLG